MGSRAGKVLHSEAVDSGNGAGGQGSTRRRFGAFEVDLSAGELRRNGLKVKLQEQPLQVLALLLERPGEVVSRDDLRRRLWAADTFVDFDHSLNAAIKRLRDALGDSAEHPRFVETVARRGYRFLGPVDTGPANGRGVAGRAAVTESAPQSSARFHIWWLVAGGAAVVLVLFGIKLGLLLGQRHPSQLRLSRLTANPADDRVRAAAISRDGRYLAFCDQTGFYLRQIDTGETHPVAVPPGLIAESISWFPDSAHLAVALTGPGQVSGLWELSAFGGSARKVRDDARSPAVSPDGNEIAFITGHKMREQVWLAGADGAQPRKLVGEEGDFFGTLAWSPDGSKIAYTRGRFSYSHGVKGAIELLDVHERPISKQLLQLSSVLSKAGLNGPLAWASDGRLIYTLSEQRPREPDSNLWSVALNREGQTVGTPVRLTSDPGEVFSISTSWNGRRIAYLKGVLQPDVYVAGLERRGGIGEPRRLTLDDRVDLPFDWTPDGREVIFVSDRTGTFSIYKQATNQTVPERLVGGNKEVVQPRLSPDGSQLLYTVYPRSGENSAAIPLMRMPLSGGASQQILEASWISNHQCARAPATECIYSVVGEGELRFFMFDPFKGRGSQFFQIKDDLPQLYNWSLSPDGATLALTKGKWVDEEPRIHLVSLHGAEDKWLVIHGWPGLASLDWAADSNSLWAASVGEEGNALLNIDLQGHARAVWRPRQMIVGWAIPSRDGRYLALHVASSSANAWMLERP